MSGLTPSSAPVDTTATRPVETPWHRRLAPSVKKHRAIVALAMTLAALYAGVTALIPLVQQIIVDRAIIAGDTPILPWLGLMAGMGLAIFALSASWRYLSAKAALRIQHDLRNGIYATLQKPV